jgi:flavin reductase (DIM6/NTAB) family NADH-FMN oxidoreductase RutF
MDQPADRWIDPLLFRRIMGRFPTGVTLIAAKWPDGSVHAMTANAFMSGSLEPPLCVVSVGKDAHMHACLDGARRYSVSILARGQEDYSNHFAGRTVPGLAISFDGIDGVPVLPDAAAQIVCRKAAVHDCGDHSLFIGEIVAMRDGAGEPLAYHAGRYGAFRPEATEADGNVPPIW